MHFIDTGHFVFRELLSNQVVLSEKVKILSDFSFFTSIQPGSSVVSANDNETARVNEGRRVSSKSPLLARAVGEVMSKETDET